MNKEDEFKSIILPAGEFGDIKKVIFYDDVDLKSDEEPFSEESMKLAFYDHNPIPEKFSKKQQSN